MLQAALLPSGIKYRWRAWGQQIFPLWYLVVCFVSLAWLPKETFLHLLIDPCYSSIVSVFLVSGMLLQSADGNSCFFLYQVDLNLCLFDLFPLVGLDIVSSRSQPPSSCSLPALPVVASLLPWTAVPSCSGWGASGAREPLPACLNTSWGRAFLWAPWTHRVRPYLFHGPSVPICLTSPFPLFLKNSIFNRPLLFSFLLNSSFNKGSLFWTSYLHTIQMGLFVTQGCVSACTCARMCVCVH